MMDCRRRNKAKLSWSKISVQYEQLQTNNKNAFVAVERDGSYSPGTTQNPIDRKLLKGKMGYSISL